MEEISNPAFAGNRIAGPGETGALEKRNYPPGQLHKRKVTQSGAQLREKQNVTLIVSLLLSYGGIENGLCKRLDGLTYRMPSQGLLPGLRVVNWVVSTAQKNAGEIAKGNIS